MKTLKFLLVSVCVLMAVYACTKNVEPDPEPQTEYDETYYAEHASMSSNDSSYTATDEGGAIAFQTGGGEVVINVDCGTDWAASNNAMDVFEAVADVEAGTLTITAYQNSIEEARTATITLYTIASHIVFAVITVTQNAYNSPEITVNTTEWHAPAVGSLTIEIAVEASADWTTESSIEWLVVEKTDSGVSLTAEENVETEERSANVSIICSDGIRSTYENISVTQDARAYISLSEDSMSFLGAEGSYAVSVESNFEWDFSYDTSNGWFSVEKNGDGVSITVTENDGEGDREGTVSFSAGDGKENNAECVLKISQEVFSRSLELVYTITADNATVKLPLSGTVDCSVDWGDGSGVETVSSAAPSHVYESQGEYTVSVNGTVTALNGQTIGKTYTQYLTAVNDWGETGLTNMGYAFYNCTGLAALPEDNLESFTDVTSFADAFYGCTSLTELPGNLFADCSASTSFAYTFYGCTGLSSVPAGLFGGCSA
ncbi:MAG: hypothetical protein LUE27_09895 [Clostridia bacterium]|nr:hypothetical protein [Clostridia bacterium]